MRSNTTLPPRYPSGPILRCIADLDETAVRKEELRHVCGSSVVLADYEIIQHDFDELKTSSLLVTHPQLEPLNADARQKAVHALIDDWLIQYASVTSSSQARQSVVNSPITTDRNIVGYRPPRYGRSVVVETGGESKFPSGLLDLKGAGVGPDRTPSHAQHSDGLEYLGVALGDYLLKRAVDEIFSRTVPTLWTVPIYAVLDLGFDIREGWHGTAPAGMHVRRAHRRPRFGMELPVTGSTEEEVRFEIEMLLRSYGLTTATGGNSLEITNGDRGLVVHSSRAHVARPTASEIAFLTRLLGESTQLRIDRVNVQLCRETSVAPSEGQLVDFGHIHARERFEYPVSSSVRDRHFCIGGVIWPNETEFVEPDPTLRLPLSQWARPKINDLCFDLALKWRDKRLSRVDVRRKLEEPLNRLLSFWSTVQA